LHADHTNGLATDRNRHTQEGARLLPENRHTQLFATMVNIFVDQQGLARLDDLAAQALTKRQRLQMLAIFVWEVDDPCILIEQSHKSDIGSKDGARLLTHQIDEGAYIQLTGQRRGNRIHGGQLGGIAFGLFE
jgi:hypothetical protein